MSELLEWIDPDGNTFDLQDRTEGVRVLLGLAGRDMPTVDFTDDAVPFQAGRRLRQVRYDAGEVGVPLLVEGDSQAQVRERMRRWASRFDPVRGDGRLRAGPRELVCRYVGGMEGAEAQAWPVGRRFVAVFRAFDPFWQDADDRTEVFSSADVTETFFSFPPLTLSPAATLGTVVVNNLGDAESWPVWAVDGPAGDVTFVNVTTGDTFTLEGVALGSGDTLTVDTRPGVKTVRDQNDNNLFGLRVPGSSLWPLVGGSQTVEVAATDTTADTQVRLSWRQRYLSA